MSPCGGKCAADYYPFFKRCDLRCLGKSQSSLLPPLSDFLAISEPRHRPLSMFNVETPRITPWDMPESIKITAAEVCPDSSPKSDLNGLGDGCAPRTMPEFGSTSFRHPLTVSRVTRAFPAAAAKKVPHRRSSLEPSASISSLPAAAAAQVTETGDVGAEARVLPIRTRKPRLRRRVLARRRFLKQIQKRPCLLVAMLETNSNFN